MSKLPYMALFVSDWLGDARLRTCEPATKGIWIDLICAMHQENRYGVLVKTIEKLSKICSCTPTQMYTALMELKATETANIIGCNADCNGIVTVENIRMKREFLKRAGVNKRVKKSRRNANVTSTPPLTPSLIPYKTTTTKAPLSGAVVVVSMGNEEEENGLENKNGDAQIIQEYTNLMRIRNSGTKNEVRSPANYKKGLRDRIKAGELTIKELLDELNFEKEQQQKAESEEQQKKEAIEEKNKQQMKEFEAHQKEQYLIDLYKKISSLEKDKINKKAKVMFDDYYANEKFQPGFITHDRGLSASGWNFVKKVLNQNLSDFNSEFSESLNSIEELA